MQVKAAGGVRTLDALLEVMALGVTRVGATATATILDDFKARKAGPATASARRPSRGRLLMPDEVRLGMLGSGFIADHYLSGLRYVPGARAVANAGDRAAPGPRHSRRATGSSGPTTRWPACARDPEVDLVVVALPNHLHVDAVRAAAAAGKGVVCTKPLARNAAESAEMLRIVEDAGVLHGYVENEVFSPRSCKVAEMVESGALGGVLRARPRGPLRPACARTSGMPRRPAAAPCSTWAAT